MVQPTRTNEAWSADLRAIIVKGLPYALGSHLPTGHPEFESLVDEVAQETLLRVLDRLETFEGRSQFTTWVHKIAIRIAHSDLRRCAGL
jgi:RNA polymerase sigma-70 factor (ECF subfamily)